MVPTLLNKLKLAPMALAFTCALLAIVATSARGDDVDKRAVKADEKPKGAGDDKEKTLTVTIKSQKNRIQINDPFPVALRVENSSKAPQSFEVMNCSWGQHWKSSNDQVSWEKWACSKNFAETVKLAPGEAYEKSLSMLLLAGKPDTKVAFKMGFTPIGAKETIWSNEVALQVGPRVALGDPDFDEPKPDDAAREDLTQLQGAWQMTYAEIKGGPLPAEQVASMRLVFKGGKHTLFAGDKVHSIGSHRLDPTQKPKNIDITEEEGPNKGMSNRGIYLLQDDLFIVCYNTPDMARPTALTSKPGSTVFLFIYKRVEAKGDEEGKAAVSPDQKPKRGDTFSDLDKQIAAGERKIKEAESNRNYLVVSKLEASLKQEMRKRFANGTTLTGTVKIDSVERDGTINIMTTFNPKDVAETFFRNDGWSGSEKCCMPRDLEWAVTLKNGQTIEVSAEILWEKASDDRPQERWNSFRLVNLRRK